MAHFIRNFREWLKNPRQFRKDAADYARHQEQLTAPADERSIWALVEQLLRPEPDDDTHAKFRLLGSRAVPALVRALGDPRFDSTKIGSGWAAVSRLERVLDILCWLEDPAAAEAVAPFARHEDPGIRKAAARALGTFGSDVCGAPVAAALQDSEGEVFAYAMMGINTAIGAGRCTQLFLDAVFEPLVALLECPASRCHSNPADLLLKVDRARALTVLLSDRFFSAQNPGLYRIIDAVNAMEETIPAAQLVPLLESLAPRAKEYPDDRAYGQGLIALARCGYADAETMIRKALGTENSQIKLGAADALVILKGATVPRGGFFRRIGPTDYGKLTEPQRLCYNVDHLNMEVNNGGFSQFFFNSAGDHARETLAGLRIIKAGQTATLLERAIAVFGPAGPSTDRGVRQDQLAAFSEEQDQALRELDSGFYEYPDNLDALISLYAAEHPEHFKDKP